MKTQLLSSLYAIKVDGDNPVYSSTQRNANVGTSIIWM